jgi:hypothetical protein
MPQGVNVERPAPVVTLGDPRRDVGRRLDTDPQRSPLRLDDNARLPRRRAVAPAGEPFPLAGQQFGAPDRKSWGSGRVVVLR